MSAEFAVDSIASRFAAVWAGVETIYESGYCLYEGGLQAALYKELSLEFSDCGIVIEPRWETQIPDIVIVNENEIVDIFELKFVPHWYPAFARDIKKLLGYCGAQPVTLNPRTAKWGNPLPISTDCRLHFVAVGRSDSKAVSPAHINNRVFLWYGRIGENGREWDIARGRAT